jgi:hypothetical protein
MVRMVAYVGGRGNNETLQGSFPVLRSKQIGGTQSVRLYLHTHVNY